MGGVLVMGEPWHTQSLGKHFKSNLIPFPSPTQLPGTTEPKLPYVIFGEYIHTYIYTYI